MNKIASMFRNIDLGLILLDGSGRIVMWNQWIERRSGMTAAAATGLQLDEVFDRGVDPRLVFAVREALDVGNSSRLSHALHPQPLPLTPNGSGDAARIKQAVDVVACEVENERYCLVQVRDVTELVRRESQLRVQASQLRTEIRKLSSIQKDLEGSERRFRELARYAPTGLFETDERGIWTFMNDRCAQLLGVEPEALIGTLWFDVLAKDDQAAARTTWTIARASATRFSEEFHVRRPDGEKVCIRVEAGGIRGNEGDSLGFLGTLLDVTEFREQTRHIEFRASRDTLTSLYNRDRFDVQLRAAISTARELNQKVVVLFIDLDGFKKINDEYGHDAGDIVLKVVGARLRRVLRLDDFVARYGGDEFAVVLPELDDLRVMPPIVAKIKQAVMMPINIGRTHARVGCSIGTAVYPQDGADSDALVARADAAMYSEKNRARHSGTPVAVAQGAKS